MTASLLWFSDSSDFPGAVSPVWGLQIKENAAKFGENSEKNWDQLELENKYCIDS